MKRSDDLGMRQARLSPEKQSLLKQRLQGVSADLRLDSRIPGRQGTGAPPLSFAQQRLWFLDQLAPGRPTYNVPFAIRCRGPLRQDALEGALTGIVARHEALRTTFAMVGDAPAQMIAPPERVVFTIVDLQHLPIDRREEEATRLSVEEAGTAFDLARGPLFRCRLIRCAEEDHLLLLTFHHTVFDGSSEPVFFGELRTRYEAILAGADSSQPALPVQYADYAIWQRERLKREVLARELAYWKAHLGDIPVSLELPTDHPRGARREFSGGVERLAIPEDVHARLLELTRKEGVTLFMTLLAAFDVFLARLTGQVDFLVGTPIAGRVHPDLEQLIGFFVNTLVLRADLAGNPTFLEALQRTKKTTLGAFDHQELPFEKLVEELHPEREQSRSPLFEILFTLQRKPADRPSPGATEWTDCTPDPSTAKLDLALTFQDSDRGLLAVMEYRTDLFRSTTIQRLLRSLAVLLREIAAHPARTILDFRIVDPAEEKELLELGAGPVVAFPLEQTYPRAFAEQVRRTPDAVAVTLRDEHLTYDELHRRSNRLARALQSLGVRPESRIAVWMEPSLALPVAYLGILKSGGAFVPLDPAYPEERLNLMIDDAGISIVVTERKYASRIPASVTSLLCLDEEPFRADSGGAGAGDPESEATPESTAYVIYTSGSTGRPKGVLVSHRSLLNHNFGVIQIMGLVPQDRVLQFFSLSFDASIEDIFPTWLAGATLVLRPEDVATTFARFYSFLAAQRITVLKLPTAYWHELAEQSASHAPPPCVRIVTIGGEKAIGQKLELWQKNIGPGVRLINLYGPTEATIAATSCELQEWNPSGALPIGRPLPNVHVVILDEAGQAVPRGWTGEICIGGAGVAKGYLHHPDPTAKKFVEDRFGGRSAGRLYRTGDRGRFREDGVLEFLGRLDNQLKVRGFRIEPGEIESTIETHPGVSRSFVTTAQDVSGNNLLVAYVLPAAKPEASPDFGGEIAAWLKSRVPAHMIPSVIMPVEAFPLLPNGKVDKKALAPPRVSAARAGMGFVAPRDPLELQLAGLWKEILGKSSIGVFDDFFALGGHSLLAARLFSRIEQVTGRNLPLATLFQAPTIDTLASLLRQEGWTAPWASLVPIRPAGEKPPLYFVHAAGGNVVGYTDLAHRLGPDQPVYGLQARGLDGNHPPQDRIEDMAASYLQEIQTLQPHGPYYLAGACSGGIVAFELARQLRGRGEEVGLVAILDSYAPHLFDAMPEDELRQMKRKQLLERFTYHASNVLFKRGRWEYLRKKTRTLRRRAMTRIWTRIYQYYSRISQPLPPALMRVEEFNTLAVKKYDPGPYPGRVTLFPPRIKSLGEPPDPEQGWGRLAQGGVEIHEVDGDHLTMLREPDVHSVARELNACLEREMGRHAGG